MAITLGFSIAEAGDAKTLTITDSTGTATGGWDGSPAVTDINGTTNLLTLTLSITTSDGTETTYDAINLYDEFGPFTTVADLVFPIDCSMLTVGSDVLGTADDQLPDGLYNIVYDYKGDNTESTALIDGVVKGKLYEQIRTIPTKYECEDNHEKDILDIIFMKGYYDALIATATVGREDEVIEQLFVLERLVENGSNYTW